MYIYIYIYIHIYIYIYIYTYTLCKGSQQGGTIKGNISAAILNRFLILGSVVVGAHLKVLCSY